MPLPAFREDGWLPSGHHAAEWPEIGLRFGGGSGSRRELILNSLLKWRDAARAKGMGGRVVLDGSFVSSKEVPGDFDLVFSYDGATEALLRGDASARRLTDYQECHALGFLGDVFALPASLKQFSPALSGLDMFDLSRGGMSKGGVEVELWSVV